MVRADCADNRHYHQEDQAYKADKYDHEQATDEAADDYYRHIVQVVLDKRIAFVAYDEGENPSKKRPIHRHRERAARRRLRPCLLARLLVLLRVWLLELLGLLLVLLDGLLVLPVL